MLPLTLDEALPFGKDARFVWQPRAFLIPRYNTGERLIRGTFGVIRSDGVAGQPIVKPKSIAVAGRTWKPRFHLQVGLASSIWAFANAPAIAPMD
jgi:hypothetical protein